MTNSSRPIKRAAAAMAIWTALAACTPTTPTPTAGDVTTVVSEDSDAGALDATAGATDAADSGSAALGPGLPVVHKIDAEAAERGSHFFTDAWPGVGTLPAIALRHTYLAWTTDLLTID